jgi:hypothetical protein
MNVHPLNDVSALIGGKTGKNFGAAGRLEFFQDSRAPAHRGLVEHLNDARYRKHADYGGRFRDCQLIEEFCQIRGCEVSDDAADANKTFVQTKVNAL